MAGTAQATVKLDIGGQHVLTAAEADGPVDALDHALRKALEPHFPAMAAIHLTDYKVRILNSDAGTSATTRVLIDMSDGEHEWSTVGASKNIIEASLQALVDGLEYGLALGAGRDGSEAAAATTRRAS
jgi:2-isopropylmalate synthase